MAISKKYQPDADSIVARRHDNGADFWATPDGRWGVGSPFSTFDCALILTELGMTGRDPLMKGAADALFAAWSDDGRFRPAPKGTMYPCYTASAARALCRLGHAKDKRLARTFEHLLATRHDDGGWRCNKVRLGKSPETDVSNPGTTIGVLDALRFTPYLNREPSLDASVETLLDHWETRRPLGPCNFGIGSLFMQVEYPFLRYNLFFYVYVLSFYDRAKDDPRFREALDALLAKTADGKLIVENPNRRLAKLTFCRKGAASDLATRRLREIRLNVGMH